MLGGVAVGADAFIAFYGLRYTLADSEVAAVEQRTDERMAAARRAKLHTHLGRLTDGQPHFLLIGSRLGIFGVENESQRELDAAALEQLMRDTAAKLRDAGLSGEAKLHLQLEAQH
jgi:hypothetical protein